MNELDEVDAARAARHLADRKRALTEWLSRTGPVIDAGRVSLAKLVETIRNHPGTGQAGRLVAFLACLYHSREYPFELDELRGLDFDLQDAVLDVLRADMRSQAEIHNWGVVDAGELNGWFADYGLKPAVDSD